MKICRVWSICKAIHSTACRGGRVADCAPPLRECPSRGTEGSNPSCGVREVNRKELMGGISHIGVSKLPFFLVREENKMRVSASGTRDKKL